ncbi:MAG: Thioredoxin [Syntrophorhabdus sp. PtaU1.Bin058]|nr:MAG: Thioredoxin [Syntrophorhabdus sp. PtaU1.Bin058]
MKTAAKQFILISILCLICALPAWGQQQVPETAMKHFQSGTAIIEKAEKSSDFLAAMAEFEAAASAAPLWPDIHYNLAMLAAETDKPAKAIKEYQIYLALSPQSPERTKIESEIARMRELIVRKRKIGMPGIKFASMKDGIAVLEVYPGAKVTQTLVPLRKGQKIVAVNNTPVVGMSLDDFFKAIETSTQDAQQASTTARLFARGTKGKNTPGELVMLKVKTPGLDGTGMIPLKKDMFRSRIIEIEEDEFETEVLKENLPVVVTFWNSGCEPCRESIPVIETESDRYAGKVKFVNINVDENKTLAQKLGVKEVPTIMVYKRGAAESTNPGRIDRNKIAEIIQSAAVK